MFVASEAKDAPVVTKSSFGDTTPRPVPARLVENMKSYRGDEGSKARRLVWHQKFERLDAQFEDGNPAPRYNSPVLIWGEGADAHFEAKGKSADMLAQAFEAITGGNDLLPDTPGADAFVGRVFEIIGVPNADNPKYYDYLPTKLLPEGFEFEGEIRIVGGDSKSPQAQGAPAVDANAQTVAAVLDGMLESSIRAGEAFPAIVSNPLTASLVNVLGVSVRGGLTAQADGKLLDVLKDAELLYKDSDGVIRLSPTS